VCVCGIASASNGQTFDRHADDDERVSHTCSDGPFSVIDLGAAATAFNVLGISGSLNNRDHVAGYVSGTNPRAEAAVYADGKVKLLGTLGGDFSYALGINNSGKIVGYSYLPGNSALHAAKFSIELPPVDLGTLGGSTSVATAVSKHGIIVGAATLSGDKETHAARFTHHGAVDLGTLGGSMSAANAVNEDGDAVGTSQLSGNITSHAALFPHDDGGLPIDLGTLGNASAANGINAGGFAVGYSGPFGGQVHATVFMSWAAPIDLGGAQSEARAINRAGDIVGYATFAGLNHAALWTHAGGAWTLADLNTLIDATTGWTIDNAWAINDRGSIEASGHKSDLQEHTLLLLRCAHRSSWAEQEHE
jgi:probable HAF family extracellular repeat protein